MGGKTNSRARSKTQKIFHAGIVGANYHFHDLVVSLIEALFGEIAGWLADHALPNPEQFQRAESAYQELMREQPGAGIAAPTIQSKINEYRIGVTDTARYKIQAGDQLLPMAHDFIIPSVYQLLDSTGDNFLGNWINPLASHISGADVDETAGQTSQGYVLEALQQMSLRLHA